MLKCKQKRWPCATLGPLVGFLGRMHPEGINEEIISAEIGMPAKPISSMFMKDNTHLSRVERIARSYGCELRLIYVPERLYAEVGDKLYDFPNAGNLYGIVEYCNKMSITLNAVASKAGCKRDTIKYALDTGDILLDILERINFSIGLRARWNFEKIDTSQ